jgi:hypothetical protein
MFAPSTGVNFANPPGKAHERDVCPRVALLRGAAGYTIVGSRGV